MTRINFFATADDLLSVLTPVEASEPIRYIERNNNRFGSPNLTPRVADTAAALPGLGAETSGQMINATSWFMTTSDAPFEIVLRPFAGREFRVARPMPSMVALTPGGWFDKNAMVGGEILFGSVPDVVAKRLMGRLQRAIKKQFPQRISGYYIGPEAFASMMRGARLCTANPAESPLEYDLPRPEET